MKKSEVSVWRVCKKIQDFRWTSGGWEGSMNIMLVLAKRKRKPHIKHHTSACEGFRLVTTHPNPSLPPQGRKTSLSVTTRRNSGRVKTVAEEKESGQ